MSEQIGAYKSSPFKCEFPQCWDREPHAHSSKAWEEMCGNLRASNVALKQEVEGLKSRVLEKDREVSRCQSEWKEICATLQAKLSLYTSWQPSDPGTKEAMECADADAHPEGIAECSHWYDGCFCYVNASVVLAHALRAAMVRLEEAEKRVKYMDEQEVGYLDTINTLESQLAALPAESKEEK